jgi:hypothetical protein
MGKRSGSPSGFSSASIVISKPPVAVQLPQPDVSANRDAPQSSCEVFHLRMKNFHPVPNYYTSRADDGLRLMPFYGDQYRTRVQSAYDRVTRRWKLWKRLAW